MLLAPLKGVLLKRIDRLKCVLPKRIHCIEAGKSPEQGSAFNGVGRFDEDHSFALIPLPIQRSCFAWSITNGRKMKAGFRQNTPGVLQLDGALRLGMRVPRDMSSADRRHEVTQSRMTSIDAFRHETSSEALGAIRAMDGDAGNKTPAGRRTDALFAPCLASSTREANRLNAGR